MNIQVKKLVFEWLAVTCVPLQALPTKQTHIETLPPPSLCFLYSHSPSHQLKSQFLSQLFRLKPQVLPFGHFRFGEISRGSCTGASWIVWRGSGLFATFGIGKTAPSMRGRVSSHRLHIRSNAFSYTATQGCWFGRLLQGILLG